MKIEDVMAQAAYSQITEAMPSIRDYLLGFEVIDSDEKENRGLGVLLAKLGDTYIFIPSIYRNGQICDMDLLYDPENNRFLPVQDNTFSYIMSKKTDISADPVPKPGTSRSGRTGGPGGVSLNLPFTMFSKVASAGPLNFMTLRKLASGIISDMLLNQDDQIEDIAGHLVDITAPELSKLAGAAISEALLTKLDTPTGYNAFAQYYSKEEIDKLLDQLKKNVELNRNKIENAESERDKEPVKVLTAASAEAKELSDEEKAAILRDGAVIVDNRGLEPSKIYKMKQNANWQAPQHNGLYELLRLDGSTLTAYVINLNAALGFDKFNTMREDFAVIPVDDGKAREVHRIDFAPLGQYYPMDMTIPLGGTPIENISRDFFRNTLFDTRFIVVTPKGEALMLSAPDHDNEGRWVHTDEDIFTGVNLTPTMLEEYEGIGRDNVGDSGAEQIKTRIEQKLSPMPMVSSQQQRITQIALGRPTAIMQIRGNTLRVPEGSRIYQLNYEADKSNSLELVDQTNALQAIAQRDKLISVTIYSTDGLLTLADNMEKKASGSKFDVAKVLVRDYALEPKTALNVIKEASAKPTGETYLIKIADATSFDMAFSQENPASVDYIETTTLSPMTNEQINDREVLENAAQSGVQQALDVELLKLMAEDDGSAREVRTYIPKLLGAVDALGRLLFLTRANDSMHEAYGDQRIGIMEKSIKSAFVKVWDIILGLQQGKVDNISELIAGDLSKSIG